MENRDFMAEKNGVYREELADGFYSETPYVNGIINGEERIYTPDGTLLWKTHYVGGVMHGESVMFHPEGSLKYKVQYEKGLEEGVSTLYYSSGVLQQESTWVKGLLNGLEKDYYPDGSLKRVSTYVGGKKNGVSLGYFKDTPMQRISFRVSYKDGKREGEEVLYHSNGNVKRIANYIDDKVDGQVRWFDERGYLQKNFYYKKGKVVEPNKSIKRGL